jgi:hypothetical protein
MRKRQSRRLRTSTPYTCIIALIYEICKFLYLVIFPSMFFFLESFLCGFFLFLFYGSSRLFAMFKILPAIPLSTSFHPRPLTLRTSDVRSGSVPQNFDK